MGYKILVCGGNGAGKTTLAAKLGELSGYPFVDTEDYYFPKTGGYKYGASRTKKEVAALLLSDLQRHENFIFTSVIADFGDEVLEKFTHVVFVSAPKDLRMQRVQDRSFQKFGDRMRPSGDLYEKEQGFFRMVEARPPRQVEDWLESLPLPVLRVDGTRPPEENAAYIMGKLQEAGRNAAGPVTP